MFKNLLCLVLFFSSLAQAGQQIKIAAASDLKLVMNKLIIAFQENHKNIQFSETYGSSGNFVTQIKRGMEVDLFFSADTAYAQTLVDAGLTDGPVVSFTQGVLVLCGTESIQDLLKPEFKKIAIANPAHAPYGRVAIEALKSSHVYDQVKSRLVFGENISQAAQFLQVGAASTGLIAQSLSLSLDLKKFSCHTIDQSLYQPLTQGLVVLKKSNSIEIAKEFTQFMLSKKAKDLFNQNGFWSADLK